MKLKRSLIKDFKIPEEYMENLLNKLEIGLKEVNTEIEEEVVHGIINNIIKDRYEGKQGYKSLDEDLILHIIKKITNGNENLLKLWYDLSNRALYPNPDDPQNKDYITKDEMLEIEYGFKFDEIND